MDCECQECNGNGVIEIECRECGGTGTSRIDILNIKLLPARHGYKELVELQKDAKRVTSQADRLKKLNPDRATSYQQQLEATLLIIEMQAEKASKK